MCEISEKWMKQGYEKGILIREEKGYADGISQGINQGFINGKNVYKTSLFFLFWKSFYSFF